MLSCCSDFNFGFRLFVLEPDPSIDYLDIARAVDGFEDLHGQLGYLVAQLARLINLTLDVPEVGDGVQSAGLHGDGDRTVRVEIGQVFPAESGNPGFGFDHALAEVRRGRNVPCNQFLLLLWGERSSWCGSRWRWRRLRKLLRATGSFRRVLG